MTQRLYYNDPYLREFDATVVAVSERDDRLVVTLDRTAFYPTSGGQPFDTGTLGPFRIVDVLDENGGTIEHVIEVGVHSDSSQTQVGVKSESRQMVTSGMAVHGVIDWGRRFDHMQQHTGQHVLSAAFDKLFGVRTVSFHLGASVSTIDLARELTSAEIAAAENQANRIVWEDRPVAIRYATAEEAAALPLRKRLRPARDASPRDVERDRAGVGPRERQESQPPDRGTLRLIEVEGFDLSACGGTHVARTGAIGIIAVGSWERFKGGQRIEFVCGGRALARFRSLRDAIGGGVRLLSVLPEELPASIERLQADAKEQKRTLASLQIELAKYRAEEIAASAEMVGDVRLVLRAIDADASGLKSLAMAIVAKPGYFVVLTSTVTPALIVVARSSDVNVPANQLLATLIARFGGRGGGKAELAQGGGVEAGIQAILVSAREDFVLRAQQ
jgi:alanyl-tRNA synthetase